MNIITCGFVCFSVARNCNIQKNSAKVAGEQSSLLYLTLFLSHKGPIITYAAVIDVKDHSFDVILNEFSIVLRIYTDVSYLIIMYYINNHINNSKFNFNNIILTNIIMNYINIILINV